MMTSFIDTWVLPLAIVLALCAPLGGAVAQEFPCTASGDEAVAFPCGFEVQQLALQKAPTLVRLQARVAQAKLPLGDQTFSTVVIKLLRGTEVLCLESLSQVPVHGSVLNLTVGENLSCDLGQAIADNASLAVQVCLGGAENCLKPIELATLPYAIKATYAGLAQAASRVNIAGQAHYAMRATADRDLLLRKKLGSGYVDFHTPEASDAADAVAPSDFPTYEEGGFLQWSPVRSPDAQRLHFVGKDGGTDRLVPLDELVLGSHRTHIQGDLLVSPEATGEGLTVLNGGVSISGSTDIAGLLLIVGAVAAQSELTAVAATVILGALAVSGATVVRAGGLQATGASDVGGSLEVLSDLTIAPHAVTGLASGLTAAGAATLKGTLTVSELKVTAALTALGQWTTGVLVASVIQVTGTALAVTAASAAITGQTTVGQTTGVGQKLTVGGAVVFRDLVTFNHSEALDSRYQRASGEARALALAGRTTFGQGFSVVGDLDLAYQPLLRTRLEAAPAPLVPCTLATEGAVYVDTATNRLTYCVDGSYQTVAGDDCGNGYVEPSEACDDGNVADGDGCSASCSVESPAWSCTPKSTQPTTCTKP